MENIKKAPATNVTRAIINYTLLIINYFKRPSRASSSAISSFGNLSPNLG